MAVRPLKGPFTVEEYHRLAELGILGEDDRVELLDGQIVEMTPIGPAHSGCVGALTGVLARLVGDTALVWVQNPVQLGEHAEPQPDLALLQPRPGGYRQAHPRPADILLVIEVADTSLESDRDVKLPLYARAGIPAAWLVDLPNQVVHEYGEPSPAGYATLRTVARGDTLTLRHFPTVTVPVAEILG